MTITRIQNNHRLSGAVTFKDLVFLSGQVPSHRTPNVAEQTKEVLSKIDTLLAAAGSDRHSLLSAQIWLKDIAQDFNAMNEVWEQWLPADSAPARATIEAPLASSDVLVEIMITAVRRS